MHCCFHLSSTSPLYAAERIWRAALDLAVIVILLAGVWWLRSPLHALPLERDEGAYALIATRWLKGAVLYRDLFDHKPPFIYLVYALAPRCAAAPVVAVRALATVYLMLVGATTTLLAWRLYGRVAALGGLLLTLVYSSSLAFEGLTFNSEAVMALPAVIACQLVVMGMLTCKRWLLCCGGIAVGVDAAGNASGYSNSVTFTLPRDTTPPTKPAVSLTDVGPTHVSLAWSSTEDGSNVWFTVFMNGTSISQGSKNTSGTFGPLEPETTYTFTVQTQDFGGNLSPLSDPITVTTEPSDHAGGRLSLSRLQGQPIHRRVFDPRAAPSHGVVLHGSPGFDQVGVVLAAGLAGLTDRVDAQAPIPVREIADLAVGGRDTEGLAGELARRVAHTYRIGIAADRERPAVEQRRERGRCAERMAQRQRVIASVAPVAHIVPQLGAQLGDCGFPRFAQQAIAGAPVQQPAVVARGQPLQYLRQRSPEVAGARQRSKCTEPGRQPKR